MNISSYLIAAVMVISCGCQKDEKKQLEPPLSEVKAVEPDDLYKGGDGDIILSTWYLRQYRAVDALNDIEGIELETGSKVDESPSSILDKQLQIVVNLEADQLNSYEIKKWIELQDEAYMELCSSLSMEAQATGIGAPSAEKARKLVELQMIDLKRLK